MHGDQEHYRAFYNALHGNSFTDISELQLSYLGSTEPLYAVIMWVGASLHINKDIYISIYNVLLLLAILRFTNRHEAGVLFSILIISNFYVLVLMTSAERLKFAYIALAIAAGSKSMGGRTIWTALSPLFHFQSFILISAKLIGYVSTDHFKRYFQKASFWICSTALAIAAVFLIERSSETIISKLLIYSTDWGGDLTSLSNIAILTIISLIVLPHKMEAALTMISCAAAAYFVGAERVNMIAVSIFIYLAARDKRTKNPLTLILMGYFSFKSLDYINRIFLYGTGF